MNLAKLRISPLFCYRYLWVLVAVLLQYTAHAQNSFTQIDTVKVYFDSDKSEVKEEFISAIQEMKDRYRHDSIKMILLQGHTDSRASDIYNLDLSKRRVDAVQEALKPLGLYDLVVKKDYMGENLPIANNSSKEGRKLNRRVDVIFTVEPTTEELPAPELLPVDTCTYDTIIYRDGIRFTMNICDYYREKECLNVVSYTSAQEMYEAGLNTVTSNGRPLISAGMLKIDKCTDACFTVEMPIPINPCADALGMSLWNMTPNGGWSELDQEIERIKQNDSLFYQFQVCESGIVNCDKLLDSLPKYTLVAKGGLRFLSATISFEAPLYSSTVDSYQAFKRTKIPAPCPCAAAYLSAIVIDKNGDTLRMALEPINQFKHRKWFRGCKVKETNRFLFFKFHDKSLYRKYILRPSDFIEVQEDVRNL